MVRRVLQLLTLLSCLATQAVAIPPAIPRQTHLIYSANKQFYALSEAEGTTSVMEVREWWFDKALWSTPNYYEWAMLADDGSFIVYSWGLVPPPYSKEHPVIEVVFSDGSSQRYYLGLFIKDFTKLKSTESDDRAWGGPVALIGDSIKVEGCDGTRTLLDVRSGGIHIWKQ